MNSRQASLFAALASLSVYACGNYSNDDLDFQLALPDRSAIEAKMQLSVTRADSAEYYHATRNAIATFNAMVQELTGLVDVVRGNVPTSRNGDERVWGPWPAEEQPGWEIRVVMRRTPLSETLLRMDYSVQVRPQGADASAWAGFLVGWYQSSSGSARVGQGGIHLLVGDVRNVGFPVDSDPGLAELGRVDIEYDNAAYPISVSLFIQKTTGSTTSGRLDYLQNQDGSGRLTFDWVGRTDTNTEIAARMDSRWIGSGAGRADLTADLTPNRSGVVTTLGIDCWGTDSVATYSYRIGDDPLARDQSVCLF